MLFNLLMIGLFLYGMSKLFLMFLGFSRGSDGEISHSNVTTFVVSGLIATIVISAHVIGFFWTFVIFCFVIPGIIEGIRLMFKTL